MSIEKERLLSLLEFASQSARLRSRPTASVPERGFFALHEHALHGLPGVRLNVNVEDGDDEIWLAVARLREVSPPKVESALLQPWLVLTQNPTDEPRLLEAVVGASLVLAGTHCGPTSPVPGRPVVDPSASISLVGFDAEVQVRAHFVTYLDTRWRPWAREEKLRRDTIRLYARLFTLKQQLEGAIVEVQTELVWGVGLGVWTCQGTAVSHPLIEQAVELTLNSDTAAIEIRPRDVDPRLQIDWYAALDNPGVANLEKAAGEFFREATTTFSPFDRGTFEPLLRTAAAHLDAHGVYWPDEVRPEDRTLPTAEAKLRVTDTWVLFARPRTNSLFLQDLEKLRKEAEGAETFPPAVAAVVTDPAATNEVIDLPSFRGVSASYHGSTDRAGAVDANLYFPRPFNDEQVRVIQLLDVSDGVVVQGPPGTGKTHTIANVICHYLALGKRVLVTSMKEPALTEVQNKLPPEIRSLAISLLANEQDGMKQFEHAIQKIASELQSLDRPATARAIRHLEESIETLHVKLAKIDRKVGDWARRNLVKVILDTEEIAPEDAAREAATSTGQFEWIPDPLGIGPEFAPQFADADVVRLREARRFLGQDIDYLAASLPQLVEFPDSRTLLRLHQDLSQFEKLGEEIQRGAVPALFGSSDDAFIGAQELLTTVEVLRALRDDVRRSGVAWTETIRRRLRGQSNDDQLFQVLEALGVELDGAMARRAAFIERPVEAEAGLDLDANVAEAIGNLRNDRRPFGLTGLFRRAEQRRLDAVRVLGRPPGSADEWAHVADYLSWLALLRQLGVRWNALSIDLGLPSVPVDVPEAVVVAARSLALYRQVKRVAMIEDSLGGAASKLFPGWAAAPSVADDPASLAAFEAFLRHHLTKNRLATAWAGKEGIQRVLDGRTGRVVEAIRGFIRDVLGNPERQDAEVQSSWSELASELSRVHGLAGYLATVVEVADAVTSSGAPRYADLLRQPVVGAVDTALPGGWRQAWRLRRLATYLDSIDPQAALRSLAGERHNVENDLSRAYRETVVKRTWLKLAENASPIIRAALQAYLNAIQKIGKGTGKRAVRYRHDARVAARQANPAVPCWIMAHYRVSESLPAEFGCFDLVVIDEASQSDLTALPSLLRAKKVLIVGDDKQVSPEGVGLEEDKVRSLMSRFLGSQVETYRSQMSPERSIYDLFKVVFARSSVMLKEHFRCVGPIIEYSKREFYNHELRPLRLPRASERLDPPLVDVLVQDGYRRGDVNLPEARFIIDEIKAIVADTAMEHRSIGVVSLLADKQALTIWERLTEELGPEIIQRHQITCGDARTFQGKERSIMFLSMVSAPNEIGAPLSRDTFAQRFNVAASRAMDRMYLVRSVSLEDLSEADKLRRSLISHFTAPFFQDEVRVHDLRSLCESPFEREMYDELSRRGYWVTPQVKVGQYRIDMVVEGHADARLAVECDGDQYHGADKWADDMQRQRVLERAGWTFWRCFASSFVRRRPDVMTDLLAALTQRGIEPVGATGAPRSVHTEHRVTPSVAASQAPVVRREGPHDSKDTLRSNAALELVVGEAAVAGIPPREGRPRQLPDQRDLLEQARIEGEPVASRFPDLTLGPYLSYDGPPRTDPRVAQQNVVSEGIVRIVEIEGPVIARRVYDTYLRSCDIRRMGHELRSTMNRALARAIRDGRVVNEEESGKGGLLYSVVRLKDGPAVRLRQRGPRSFDEIPPSELQAVARFLTMKHGFTQGADDHLRAVLEVFDLSRLTTQVGTNLLEILSRSLPAADRFMKDCGAPIAEN